MIKSLFVLSLFMIFYVHAGYPMFIWIIGKLRSRKITHGTKTPKVSIIIAAFNEERDIRSTIENKLALDYPPACLEIIVVSDGSTDRTDQIVAEYTEQRVRLIRQEPRQGKTAALNLAIPRTSGEIIVFSDANSIYAPNALRMLVRNFADADVGYVTGKMIYTSPDGAVVGDGCSAYMRYENFLRRHETLCGSIVGVDGGVDGVRKELYRPMEPDQLPDFVLPLQVVEQGRRVVYEPEAVLKEAALKSSSDEYRMRVRVTLRALWALRDMRQLLDIRQFGIYSWQLLSHKVMRYGCWVFLLACYLASAILRRESGLFASAFILQTLFYACAILASYLEKRGAANRFLYIPYYFTLINMAAAHACIKFMMGDKIVMWTPRKG